MEDTVFKRIFGLPAALVLTTSPALAHLDPSQHGSFAAGFSHPLFGLDHILAMIAVGLWAAMIGGRSILSLPTAFVLSMIAGFGIALAGVSLPLVEPMILASVILLGALVALAIRVPAVIAVVCVGAFGVFHGYAHGGEMGSATGLAYGAGFVAATALLHAFGVLVGYAAIKHLDGEHRAGTYITRGLGALMALSGVALTVA
ncbi:HupE/UreJ family protein [Roseibium sp. RKSG952]|uniref:HupE/UreJ family protein n=1 Tax=Roseibium sp. RKSG952 TaxID=2529384 RepID=UPI0012BCFB9B|nr:HupE/UreJ family protein [Roseibium sp. RKSG952]MTH95563.1 HupE/UreJ family protein [Roseibium sp. RKSG952]